MVLNLNRKFVTKEDLLKHISDYEIYSLYIDMSDVKPNTRIKSPLSCGSKIPTIRTRKKAIIPNAEASLK